MHNKFEEDYRWYNDQLNHIPISVDFIKESTIIFKKLSVLANTLYDGIENKLSWLKSEILSLKDTTIKISIGFSIDFELYYKNSTLRFELIEDYLKNKQLKFHITEELMYIYEYYLDKDEVYKIIRIISSLMQYSIPNNLTKSLIINILTSYYKDEDFEDNTILLVLRNFIYKNLSISDKEFIIKEFPQATILK